MYDTARRVALVKQRVRENTRRRQRCEAYIACRAACMLLCAVLMQAADAFVGAGTDRRMGQRSARCCCGRTQAAMCWWPLCHSRRRWSSPHCASGSESEKNRKKVRRTSTPDTKRRRKANEKTNTQHPAPMLHVADAADDAADDCVCSG